MEAAASAGASAEDADTDMEPEACPSLASVVAASSVPPTRCSGTDHGPPNNNTSHLSNVNIPPQERYAVGDHCYFETSASGPYQVRRLEELVRDDNRIDVKVFVYSRKCDLPVAAQRHLCGYVDGEEELDEPAGSGVDGPVSLRLRRQRLSEYSPRELSEHRVASRELFLTHDAGGPIVETLPTALIRGKCRVLHHSPGLSKTEYTQRDDTFFCERVWFLPDGDRPGQLLVDREKRIHFDSKATFQAVIPPCRPHPPPDTAPDHATLLWTPGRLPEDTVETFVAVTVAVGLMARVKSDHGVNELPHVTAQLAGRDCMHTLAADILHQNGYDLKKAVAALVGNGRRLVSRRSLLETFDESDMQFFQLGLERTGRSLKMIHQDWLPWRKYADIVGFYYLYKGTDLYKEYRMMKASDRRQKKHITSVHVPHLQSKSCLLKNVSEAQLCYGCLGPSKQWYAWVGLSINRRQVRPLCSSCWRHWKRYACLQRPWKRPPHAAAPPERPTPHSPVKSHSKQHLLAHRSTLDVLSPPGSQAADPLEEEDLLEEQEFLFASGREWVVMRRVASEALYEPRRVALYPQMAVQDVHAVEAWYRACPGMLVDYYQRRQRKRRTPLEAVISKVRALRDASAP